MNGTTVLDADVQIYTEHDLDEKYKILKTKLTTKEKIRNTIKNECACNGEGFKNWLYSVLPILVWLPKYEFKNNIIADVSAGLTVGVVHIPQGLAYGLLATLPPIVGMYVSFFPVIIYVLFGTSRHVSIGTFAVVSLLISAVLDERVPAMSCGNVNETSLENTTTSIPSTYSNIISTTGKLQNSLSCEKIYENRKIEVAAALSVCVGIWQVAMHIFRLGLVTVFLSESLVSGFVSGASIHVITSQIPKLFGITVERYSGPLALIYTYVDFFRKIATTNWGTFGISCGCMVFLLVGKELNIRFKKKLPLPIPWELGIVIISTVVSHFARLEVDHGVVTVGDIPTGISTNVPQGSDIAMVFFDAIPLAVVAFTVEIALCQIFATKHGYEVQSNQELLALGVCNIFGSFFSCFPSAASLSRSVIYEEIGGNTQLGSIVSSAVVLTVLLWIGPLFQPLPQAALAVIIIVNVKSIAMMWRNVKPLWKISRLDAVNWIVAWLSVVLLGVVTGLIAGVAFSVFTVLMRTRNSTGSSLQRISHTGQYRSSKKYKTESLDEKLIVFQFNGPIYFANKDRFIKQLNTQLGYDPVKKLALQKVEKTESDNQNRSKSKSPQNGDVKSIVVTYGRVDTTQCPSDTCEIIHDHADTNGHLEIEIPSSRDRVTEYSHVIFDMGQCSFMDSDGAKLIRVLYDTFEGLNVKLLLSSCNDNVKTSLRGLWEKREPATYVSLERAIEFAMQDIASSNSNDMQSDSDQEIDNMA